jgi:hypothetical protein
LIATKPLNFFFAIEIKEKNFLIVIVCFAKAMMNVGVDIGIDVGICERVGVGISISVSVVVVSFSFSVLAVCYFETEDFIS